MEPGHSDRPQHGRISTDRKYVARQPLFSGPTSILKKENPRAVYGASGVSRTRVSGVELSQDDLRGPSDTVPSPDREEPATPRCPHRSSSSSVLEVQRLDLPQRPQLTSTVLHPTYTSKYRLVRHEPRTKASRLPTPVRAETFHQRNFRACAVPDSLPPSPDRRSAEWDPDSEYQSLLDYTYPLAAGGDISSRVWPTMADLQDSGIELDRWCSSVRSHDEDLSVGTPSPTYNSFRDSLLGRPQWGVSSTHTSLRSTSLLPKSWTIEGDLHEEFWLLPDHLEELQSLTQQVNDVSSLLDGMHLGVSSLQAEKDEDAAAESAAPSLWTPERERVQGLSEKLRGAASRRREDLEDSLMEHVQIFCSHLQQLIQWLHTIPERKAGLTSPSLDLESVRRSLAEYQSFQREVDLHKPLTSRALKSGRSLLSCINSIYPEIRDALSLMERQPSVLENQTQQLLSSILSAVETLTQPSSLDLQVEVDQDLVTTRQTRRGTEFV